MISSWEQLLPYTAFFVVMVGLPGYWAWHAWRQSKREGRR